MAPEHLASRLSLCPPLPEVFWTFTEPSSRSPSCMIAGSETEGAASSRTRMSEEAEPMALPSAATAMSLTPPWKFSGILKQRVALPFSILATPV